jgi:hypothetical protein
MNDPALQHIFTQVAKKKQKDFHVVQGDGALVQGFHDEG